VKQLVDPKCEEKSFLNVPLKPDRHDLAVQNLRLLRGSEAGPSKKGTSGKFWNLWARIDTRLKKESVIWLNNLTRVR
jgi:hypothetical protein